MSIKKHSFIGCKFYNQEGEILRVKAVRNRNLFIMIDESGNVFKMSRQTLDENYIKLKPIGIMSIFEVKIGGGKKDVICTLHRSKDLDQGIQIPYIAARQTMINLFAAPLENNPNRIPIGMCMSNKTCPTNVDFTILLQNEGIISSSIVSIYLDDTLEDALSFVNTVNYDNVIHSFRKKFDPEGVKNIGDSLYSFLDNNGWMSEFDNAYNIINLNDNSINMKNNDIQINIIKLQYIIERKIEYKVSIQAVVKYDETIDLFKLQDREEFLFIRDNHNSIFIIKYIKGDKVMIIPNNQKEYALELLDRLPR